MLEVAFNYVAHEVKGKGMHRASKRGEMQFWATWCRLQLPSEKVRLGWLNGLDPLYRRTWSSRADHSI